MEEKIGSKELLGKIYLLYIKSKIALAESHLMRWPSSYFKKFDVKIDPEINVKILDYIVMRMSPVYLELSRKSWILFVLEITKILSKSNGEKFGIKKLYNKHFNKEFKDDISLDCFKNILSVIDNENPDAPINKLKVLRDKFYAHTDKDISVISNEMFPTYDELWQLMDKIEEFIIAMYSEYDSAVELKIERFLKNYGREFERTYKYFQNTTDLGDIYRLKSQFSEAEFEAFRNV